MELSLKLARHAKRLLAKAMAGGMLVSLPACGIPNLRQPDQITVVPPTFPTTTPEATTEENSANVSIQDFFSDPTLTALIDQAVANNLELKILNEDIQIAGNEVLARRGAYLPLVSFRAGAGFEKSSRYTRNGAVEHELDILPGRKFPNPLPDYLIAADLTWQIDIYRMLRNARDAAALRTLATAEGRNYVVTRLVADIAENYYGLMALDKRMENLDQTIALQEHSLKIAEAKFRAGQGTLLAVQRFQAELSRNQSEKLIIKQEIVEVENRINTQLNRFPQPVERNSAAFYDLNLHALSAGVPAQLLQNRPDIRQAERELEAAGLDVKVARARFFPQPVLNAGIGYEAFNPKFLFNTPQALIGNVAGGLVAPLVNRMAIQAEYLTANARQLQAVYDYQRTVLVAFTEVVNRLTMVENYRQSIDLKKKQLDSLEQSVASADKLFQGARVEYSEVLFAQRDLRDARTALIDAKRQQLSAVVNAYQALGGGDLLNGTMPAPPQLHRWLSK